MTVINGWIADFWEQGMEEFPWLIIQDEAFAAGREGQWDRGGMYHLQTGDHLTVYDDEGEIVFDQTLQPRWIGWRRLSPQDYRWFPKGWDHTAWRQLFRRRPAYRATCRRG